MGKLTILTGPFSIAMLNYQRVSDDYPSIILIKPIEKHHFENIYLVGGLKHDFFFNNFTITTGARIFFREVEIEQRRQFSKKLGIHQQQK